MFSDDCNNKSFFTESAGKAVFLIIRENFCTERIQYHVISKKSIKEQKNKISQTKDSLKCQ
jgi:hypothetical protein